MHVIATAGHVDHGKSTLVRALTDMEPDRFAEEQRRGMTIDLGFAWTDLPSGRTVAFVDVPGHERFVTTMLAGVGPVPAVLLVVAADEGWRQQTQEHVSALDALGVRHGVVAVTRTDLAPAGPVLDDVRGRLAGTSLAGLPAVAVSGRTAQGLPALRTALDSLVDRLPAPRVDGPVRLWVDRSFTIRGSGTVVTGTLGAGALRVGDGLVVATAQGRLLEANARGLQALGAGRPEVRATARVAVNLRGVDAGQVQRGDAVLTPGTFRLTALVDVHLPLPTDDVVPAHLVLHVGSAAVPARVRPLGRTAAGLAARLSLDRALPLAARDVVLLRDPGRHVVVAGALVLDSEPAPLRRRGAAAARARELTDYVAGPPDGAALLLRRGLVGVREFEALGAVPPGDAVRVGSWVLDAAHAARLRQELRRLVAEHRATCPLDAGPAVGAVRDVLALPEDVVIALAAAPLAVRDGRVVDSSGPAPLPAAIADAVAQLTAGLRSTPFLAPDADRLRELGLGPRELAAAERAGVLERLGEGVVLLHGAPSRAAQVLAKLPQPFTVSQARDALGTTRRVAVPLLERMDRQGLTLRRPDDRRTTARPPPA